MELTHWVGFTCLTVKSSRQQSARVDGTNYSACLPITHQPNHPRNLLWSENWDDVRQSLKANEAHYNNCLRLNSELVSADGKIGETQQSPNKLSQCGHVRGLKPFFFFAVKSNISMSSQNSLIINSVEMDQSLWNRVSPVLLTTSLRFVIIY